MPDLPLTAATPSLVHRAVLAATLTLAAMPAVSDAGPKWIRAGACNVVTDSIGDVRLNDVAASDAADDTHVDLNSVYVLHRGKTVDVTIYVEQLSTSRRGTWSVAFASGKTTYGVRASLGSWSSPPTSAAFMAGPTGKLVPVKGDMDVSNSTVTVSVPYSVLGAAGRKGATWSRFAAYSEEVFADVLTGTARVRLHDAATTSKTFRAGSTCKVPTLPPPPPPPPPGNLDR